MYRFDSSLKKASNSLKKIVQDKYHLGYSEEYEKSYLMLAELFCEKGKFDIAQDFCKRCLMLNRSCSKGWEIMGAIMERNKQLASASDCYKKSYELGHKSSPLFGFKLALSYFKTNRLAEAIEVCSEVLEIFPNYEVIREEVLEKCFLSLRP